MFVDGENLVFRYQESVCRGAKPKEEVVHVQDTFVWHPRMTQLSHMFVRRVNYYTSSIGDDEKITGVRTEIAKTIFRSYQTESSYTGQIVPHVYKKLKNSQKTRTVDINISVDSMRHAHQQDVDLIILASGDGDFLPLIEEIMRQGKQVYSMAFRSGLDESLTRNVDEFILLDDIFFEKDKSS